VRSAPWPGASLVLLAHHRRDQAETFVLQALRGAGPAGLAAMPRSVQRDGITWARPWLDLPREAIESYVRQHRIRFVDDASNADLRYARNRLRLQVMPALRQAFPQAEAALAEAAQRTAEAQAALAELADHDLRTVCEGAVLRVAPWAALPPARRRNALRAWLRERLGRGAPNSLLERLMVELPQPGPACWPAEGLELRRYRGWLVVHAAAAAAGPVLTSQALLLRAAGTYPLPAWGGSLRLQTVPANGVALALLQACELRARAGSERFQQHAGGPPRSLKKAFQSVGVPAWQRMAPLLYGADGRLLYVPGLGVDARALARPGEAQVLLEWLPAQ
jgi:tRNA(Ile)-lysidine synthase